MSATANEMSASTSSSADPLQQKVLALTFNQDSTALAMGTEKGYYLFAINQKNKTDETESFSIEPITSVKYIPFEEVLIVERVFSSSLLAIVSNQDPRKLNLYDIRRGIEIDANKFPNHILAVKMNGSRVIVCLEEAIWIFNKLNMKTLHIIRGIQSNTSGLCALSSKNDAPYLAYPTSSTVGIIKIFDTTNLEQRVTINAHNGPVVAMSFDMSGTKIATASDKGTVIRVHNVVDGSRLIDVRRGVRRFATIYSLAFSPDSTFLAASSNTGTIHVFRLVNPAPSGSVEPRTVMGIVGGLIAIPAYFLPTPEVWTQDRSFATVHLKSGALKTTIAMNVLNDKLLLFVAAYDAVISTYEVNTNDGGECSQIGSQSLLANTSVREQSAPDKNDELEGTYPPDLLRNDNEAILNPSASANNDES